MKKEYIKPNATFIQGLYRLQELEGLIAPLQEELENLKQWLFMQANSIDFNSDFEGTETKYIESSSGDDMEIKISSKFGFNSTVDVEEAVAICNEYGIKPEEAFIPKLNYSATKFKDLEPTVKQALLSKAITTKRSKPSINVVFPNVDLNEFFNKEN